MERTLRYIIPRAAVPCVYYIIIICGLYWKLAHVRPADSVAAELCGRGGGVTSDAAVAVIVILSLLLLYYHSTRTYTYIIIRTYYGHTAQRKNWPRHDCGRNNKQTILYYYTTAFSAFLRFGTDARVHVDALLCVRCRIHSVN